MRNFIVECDKVSKLLRRHSNVQDEFMIISERLGDVVDFFLLQIGSECLLEIEFELGDVELLAHVDVPVGFRNYTWNEPVTSVEFVTIIFIVAAFGLRKWTQKVRSVEMGLQLLVGQIIGLDFEIWEDVRLWHVDHDRFLIRDASSGRRTSITIALTLANISVLKHAVIGHIWFIPDDGRSQRECLGTSDLRHQLNMSLNVVLDICRRNKSELPLVFFSFFSGLFVSIL